MKFRKRFISEGLYQNKPLEELDDTCFRLFTGLWCYADRKGLLVDDPELIRSLIYPRKGKNVDHWLQELHNVGLIHRYELDGGKYLLIPTFTIYQTIHKNEAQSVIPINDQIYKNVAECSGVSLHCNSNSKSNNKSKSKSKDKDPIPYESIIDDLNKRAGTRYLGTTPKTRELIKKRWKEGFRFEHFEIVHRKKVEDWLDNPDYVGYLRPITLYSNKFESYLNQQETKKKDGKDKRLTEQEFKDRYIKGKG